MSYRYDHLLVIANKYEKASADNKAMLYETYDQLRDLTVSGNVIAGSGLGGFPKLLMNIAQLIAPGSFMPVFPNSAMNIAGTSYYSPVSGGNSIIQGGQAAIGLDELGSFKGFPTGGAASLNNFGNIGVGSMNSLLSTGIGGIFSSLSNNFSIGGMPTGGAASIVGNSKVASAVGTSDSLIGNKNASIVLPVAGVVSGVGGLIGALAPYFGPFGLLAGMAGKFAHGYAGSVLNAYQTANGRIINNANTILANKIKNIETVSKELDAQASVVRKMLKESVESTKKAIQDL